MNRVILICLMIISAGRVGAQVREPVGAGKTAEKKFGIGVAAGSPVGLVGEWQPIDRYMIRVAGGKESGNARRLFFSADVVRRFPDVILIDSIRIPFEVGIGTAFLPAHETWDEIGALRIPFGLYYEFASKKWEIGLVGAINLAPSPREGFNGSDDFIRLIRKF